mmetsp:Transcript_168532/g.535945  ORF Transcript_168532/g.535945 Transcript_168532/m.535945 type:complete len:115 (-) Transcript_168532:742-1086(-)
MLGQVHVVLKSRHRRLHGWRQRPQQPLQRQPWQRLPPPPPQQQRIWNQQECLIRQLHQREAPLYTEQPKQRKQQIQQPQQPQQPRAQQQLHLQQQDWHQSAAAPSSVGMSLCGP